MGTPRAVRAAALSALQLCLTAGTAASEPEARAAGGLGELQRIDFEAPATCATVQVFQDEVRGRTARLRLTQGEQWTSRFEIAVRDEGELFVGALTVHADRASSERREVSAKSCEEVLETLALIVAVAIDPNASLEKRPKRTEPPTEAPPPVREAPAPPALTPPEPLLPPRASAAARPASSAAWHLRAALGAEARGAFASDAAIAGSLALELEQQLPERWGWAVRLSALRGLASELSDPFDRRAQFRWTAGRFEGVVLLYDASQRAALGAGLGVDVGAIEATSVLSKTRLWASGLAFLRARWSPVPTLGLEATAGALAPFTRDRFVLFDPDAVVYRERSLLGFAGLALAVQLY